VKRGANQLPRGKHGLPNEYVVQHQRRRILDAVGEMLVEVGYGALTVELIREQAEVSRRTYYDHFADKEAGVVAYFDTVTTALLAAIDASLANKETGSDGGLDRVLTIILRLVAEHPVPAQVWLLTLGRSCERLSDRRDLAMAQLMQRVDRQLPAAGQPGGSPLAVEVTIGGVCELLRHRLRHGDRASDPAARELVAVLLGSSRA